MAANGKTIPVLTVISVIVVIWYACVVWMNAPFEYDKAERAGTQIGFSQLVSNTMSQQRPVLPAIHQIAEEMYKTIVLKNITSKRSLVYHAWITLSATLLGFAMGTLLGVLLAVGIVHNRAMDKSVMPWVITSQTIPIHRGVECHRTVGPVAQGTDLHLPVVLPHCRRHGERLAQSGPGAT